MLALGGIILHAPSRPAYGARARGALWSWMDSSRAAACDLSLRSPLSGVHPTDRAPFVPLCIPKRPPLRLAVLWINMHGHEQRARHAIQTIARAIQSDGRVSNLISQHSGRTERIEAVAPTCLHPGQPCMLSAAASSSWNATDVFGMEPPKLRQHVPQSKRRHAIGNFLSHLTCYRRCLEMRPPPDACLVMEDDAGLARGFLQTAPCLLDKMEAVDPNWHALRLGCWGARFAGDCVRPPALFRAQSHPFNKSAEALAPGNGMAYGGAHLTLVRPATLSSLISTLVAQGVMPIDVALTNPPRHQWARKQQSVAEVHSYVSDTPGAFIAHGAASLPGS